MGKVIFTPLQKNIFEAVAKDAVLSKNFYFTGGTALSAFHLYHRESEDLDFFSENNFESNSVVPAIEKISSDLKVPFRFTENERVRIYEFVKNDKLLIKVDFNFYPYKRLEKGLFYKDFAIDSLLDIATNKLLTINQRTEVKDFVDLYFLLNSFTLWDLIYGVEKKFGMEMDLMLIGMDFMKVENFEFMPKMIKPLTLPELQSFFKEKTIELAKRVIE
ncbi:MAG: nucleotidyl transferase AbiEii/AbiGii toxin family protein [Candidatus Levybacteria bacterium]|nr:nucleotidyl transferase AbiEii/AbiGii toxin family protein [Candidatus Levybacteria bacterium]